jgi:hypothetical protein
MAMNCVPNTSGTGLFLTWNHHRLARHNEERLHCSKPRQSKSSPGTNSKSELDDEDCTEEADADGNSDIGGTLKPDGRIGTCRIGDKF